MLHLTPVITGMLVFLAAVLGTVMGSFFNCAALRLVRKEPIARGRSHCAVCGHTLGAADLIPVVSWLVLRGRCRYCGKRISPRYPAIELFCAVMYVSLLLRFDLTWELARFVWLLSLLMCAALVDLEDGWIPDRLLLAAAVGFFPLAYLSGGAALLREGLIGAAALFLPILAIVSVMDKILKTDTMGGGDLKLFALLGLYFGWKQGIFLVVAACALGLMISAAAGRMKARTQTPFGPALFLAAWLTALAGEPFVNWYTGLFRGFPLS